MPGGDALFVVLDPYWYTPVRPEASGDWSLTLGRTQWGGRNLDDSWRFDLARPGWAMPIHQLLVANNVTAFFHGHDHIYARQELEGVRYQEGPQPSARNTSLGNRAQVYNYRNGSVLDGVGYIRVRVSPSEVRTEFVRTWTPSPENATRTNGEAIDVATIPAVRKGMAVLSAASYVGGAAAPGSIAAAFGDLFADVSVTVKDSTGTTRTAKVIGRGAGQINFIVLDQTAPGIAEVSSSGKTADLYMAPVSPALVTANADGRGVASAIVTRLKADGTTTTEMAFQCGQSRASCIGTPIDVRTTGERVYLSLFGTGIQKAALKTSRHPWAGSE